MLWRKNTHAGPDVYRLAMAELECARLRVERDWALRELEREQARAEALEAELRAATRERAGAA